MMDNYDYVIIEDNEDDVELIIDAMNGMAIPMSYHLIKDGDAANKFLDKLITGTYHLPKLILLDLNLPKVSGLDVLNKIKQNAHLKYIPIVVFTSSQSAKDLKMSYELGVNAYVVKPIDFEEFQKAVHGIGKFWLLCNTAP